MTAETKLLAEIIRHAPDGASWFISTDSYSGIKYILGNLLIDTEGSWIVNVTEGNRGVVAKLIERHGLAMKIVHTSVESVEHTILFRGYDAMCTIIINKDFSKMLSKNLLLDNLEILLD